MSDPLDGKTFEPVIIGFTCNWCSYRAADMAGMARMKYPPNIRLVRVMCSGRLDPTFIFKAFASGADGVMVTGCHPGDCHYIEQNYKLMRRFILMQRTLEQMGIEPGRLKLTWASAAEGAKFSEEVTNMVEEVRRLGPLNWPSAETMDEWMAKEPSIETEERP
ncbi:MAG TPA: hydrogenase iron-sulfur subunit [Anaerolineaceae bacterium]|nr:hydrogenase iron-sulfur subunit [Anaerolineaceae bacterium]